MKFLAVMALLFTAGSAQALASGGFSCESQDKTILVEGGVSSAGVWVQSVTLNGKSLVKQKDFTADQIYLGDRAFNFVILDQDYNQRILKVETVRHFNKAAGLSIVEDNSDGENSKIVSCEFLY